MFRKTIRSVVPFIKLQCVEQDLVVEETAR